MSIFFWICFSFFTGTFFGHMLSCWLHNNRLTNNGIREVRPIPPPPKNKHIGSTLGSLFEELGEKDDVDFLTEKKLENKQTVYYTRSVPTVEQVRERIKNNKPLDDDVPIKRIIKINSK